MEIRRYRAAQHLEEENQGGARGAEDGVGADDGVVVESGGIWDESEDVGEVDDGMIGWSGGVALLA